MFNSPYVAILTLFLIGSFVFSLFIVAYLPSLFKKIDLEKQFIPLTAFFITVIFTIFFFMHGKEKLFLTIDEAYHLNDKTSFIVNSSKNYLPSNSMLVGGAENYLLTKGTCSELDSLNQTDKSLIYAAFGSSRMSTFFCIDNINGKERLFIHSNMEKNKNSEEIKKGIVDAVEFAKKSRKSDLDLVR